MFLEEGDLFELESGHEAYVRLPNHFCYGNAIGVFDKMSETEVRIGHDAGSDGASMDTCWLIGRYVVIDAKMEGGGTGHGPGDTYPDGHRIKAQKLNDKGEPENIFVKFYQSGSFTCMNKQITATGKATKRWVAVKA